MNKVYYMVWNQSGSEAFVTDDPLDAKYASTGIEPPGGVSSLASEFRELYDDESYVDFRITTVTMDVEDIR